MVAFFANEDPLLKRHVLSILRMNFEFHCTGIFHDGIDQSLTSIRAVKVS